MGQLFRFMLLCVMVVLIAACGGGGGGSSIPANTVNGIAATGKALGNAAVTIIDSKSATKNTTTSASGSYSFNVTDLTAPFLIKVDAGSGKSLYSFANNAGTANINPFSDVIVRSASGGANVETSHSAIKGNIVSAIAQLKSKFATMLSIYGVPSDYDPLSSSYAIGNPLDKLFDFITVTIATNGASVTINNIATGSTIYNATITTSGAFGGTVTDSNIPTPSSSGSTNTFSTSPKVVSGYYNSMALKADGTVWSWGNNDDGQIGDGTTTSRSTPVQVGGLSNIIDIKTGDNTPIALKNDGSVLIWGRDQRNVNRTTQIAPILTTPQQLAGISQVVAIAGGHSHGVALKGDGTVWWWGRYPYPQITYASTPTQIAGLTGVKAITSNYALKDDGTLWEYNFGATPTQVSTLSLISSLMELSNALQYAVKADGKLWSLKGAPTQITKLSGLLAISDMIGSGGYLTYSTVALKSDGTVWYWGIDVNPTQISSLSGIISISCGIDSVLALKSDGTIWAWGGNLRGQLGDGTSTNRATPVQVSGLSLK